MTQPLVPQRERISKDLLKGYLERQARWRENPEPPPQPQQPSSPETIKAQDPFRPVVMRSSNSTSR